MAQAPIRVLLVEDDEDNRELMAEVLEAAGFVVTPAPTGQEALAALAAAAVDVVVTDVGLPDIGGVELAGAVKRLAPGVPVVAVTGYGERQDISGARGREIDAVLVKPVEPDALVQLIGEVVARARAS